MIYSGSMQLTRPCPVCGQTSGKTYSLREMQFGTREKFNYILCSCGTMRVREYQICLSTTLLIGSFRVRSCCLVDR